jgi:hypothetical protein
VRASRFRRITCLTCGAVFNSKTGRIVRHGDIPLPPGDDGSTGVREPLAPRPLSGAGAAALPLPTAER